MPCNRFFVKDLSCSYLKIEEAEFHHLKHVMRLKEGEEIELIDGMGTLAMAKIEKLERSLANVQILSKKIEPKKPAITFLAMANPKFSHLEFAIEKATEIGIDTLIFFPSMRSEKISWSDAQKERLKSILISAIKQSGRLYLPEVIYLEKIENLQDFQIQKFFCHLLEPRKKVDHLTFKNNPTCLIVGPEKGFAIEDVEILENKIKAKPITLGKNILRMETASIVAATLLCHYLDNP
jgi:16S rRNA (uracil1498-N3)-methyltransferase